MTKTSRRPRPGKAGGKRRAGSRAAAKKRARAKLRASRPRQKPKRSPKPRSRASRAAAIAERREQRGQGASTTAKPRPAAARAKPKASGTRPRTRRAAPPPAFPQSTGASAKHQLLFRMVKARASVLASIQGMSAASAERPLAEGKWTTRETILHLVTRDRARLREMEAALLGTRPSWDGTDDARQAVVNEEDLRPLRRLAWEDAVRLLLTTRQLLMEAVESIPEEPEDVWLERHPLGWMFQRLPGHDLHHADLIKRARSAQAG